MRSVYLALLLAVLAAGCSKDPLSPDSSPASDFTLKRYREFPNGQNRLEVENALNLDESTGFNAVMGIKGQNLVIDIGGRKLTTVEPKLSASIVFFNISDPSKVAGTYTFPGDRNKADVFFLESIPNGWTGRNNPESGTIEISYDAKLKRWNGKVTSLRYGIPYNADFTLETHEINFRNVQFRQ